MRNRVIFELKLNETDSIIAMEKENYQECYDDSILYAKINGEKIMISESSFCYGFGPEMYFRIYNPHSFDSSRDFTDLLKKSFRDQKYDLYDDYCFTSGDSSNNCSLMLYKQQNGYTLLIIKLFMDDKGEVSLANLVYSFEIDEQRFFLWQKIITDEYERRTIIEGESISQTHVEAAEWEKYFQFLRTKNNP